MADRMSSLSFTFPLKIMARPFRWPQKQDLLLDTEVASRLEIKQREFEPIANVLSVEFGKLTPGKQVSPTARACRERMERLLEKYINEDEKALKREDKIELAKKEKDLKKKKEKEKKKKAEEMREAALAGITKKKLDETDRSSDNTISDADQSGDDGNETTASEKSNKKKKASMLRREEELASSLH
ncbi:hypothetical protein AWC38_SpisGene24277 [Stylophora pistillata]|uniref:Uncharacterized protein n=1 Tax=Stylophora pistillata TaxID=50429 RepID=A0A2B4R650_STYPI|nr:hypothetical protein AWC38_SpisGene24277 [Stylophora pistillata]